MRPFRPAWLAGLLPALVLTGCGVFVPAQQRIAAARRDIQGGDWQRARIELNKALESRGHHPQAWLLLAEVSLDTGDTKGAKTALDDALAAGATGPELDALRVRMWLAAGQPQAVLDAVTRHAIHLSEPERSFALARAHNELGKPDEALASLKSVLAQQPGLAEAHVLMGESLAGKGALAAALQEAEAAERLDPKSSDAPLLAGRLLMAVGQFAAAERSLSLALKHMPPDEPIGQRATALSALTDMQLRLGQLDAAAGSQRALARCAPGAALTQLLGARIKIARGDARGAVDELELLTVSAPDFMQARLLLGAELLAAGKPEQAQVQLAAVLERIPGSVEARALLATAQLDASQPEAALNVLVPVLTAQAPNPRLLALAGAIAVRLDGADHVLAVLASADGVDPQNKNVRLNLAQAYLGAGRPDLALGLLQPLGAPGNLRAESLLIAALRGAEGPRAADAEVQRLLAAQPRSSAILNAAAEYHVTRRDFAAARRLLGDSLKLDPENPATSLELARVDAAAGDLQAAQGILRDMLALHPQALPVRIALAQVLADAKVYPQALSVLGAAGPSATGQTALEFATARVYLAEGDLPQASRALDRAIALDPGNPAIAHEGVTLLLQAKQYGAALERVATWLVSRPADPDALALEGNAEEGLGNTAAALTAYAQAQKLQPSGALAVKLLQIHRAANAVHPEQSLVQWLARNPHDVFAREALAQYELETRQLKSAGLEFAAVLAQAPDNVVALNDLAWIDDEIGDPHALSLAERAYQLAPDSPDVNDTLGWILAREGQAAQALPRLAQAVTLAPTDPEIEYHYAYALFKRGQKLQARTILSKLLSKPAAFDSRDEAERLLAAAKG